MSGSGGGCPIKHTQSGPPPVATATEDGQPSSLGSQQAAGGRWAGVAAWLPFSRRGSSADDATGVVANSSVGGSSSPASDGVQRTALGTKQQGGCPVNSSEGGDSEQPAAASGCPVQHDSAAGGTTAAASESTGLGRVWELLTGGGGGGGDVADPSASPLAPPAPEYNARNNEYVYGQEVAAGQEMPLSTARQRSSIPKAEFNPDHQPQKEAEKWVYPSEQQYYNAIKRKGYKASATDMPSTLAIHNAVNEKGWEMVKEWERARAEAAADASGGSGGGDGDAGGPKLLRFTGRPQDTSPKAWIKSTLLGYRPPFDRHDWVVKRPDGTEARYVIDFYAGKAPPGSSIPVAMHLDVRPALDSVDAAVDRTRMFYSKEVRPYLSVVLDAFRSDRGPPPPEQDAPSSAAR